ncbi:competence type IV pilus minor pilin ComGG [Bacillus sp. JJ1764]|uniref:competence type IV pilus minor pilin ComGG n=1 Tax=Bacillus sp. JJ1764 TaxID=3122964 RepID=UPI002FFDA314
MNKNEHGFTYPLTLCLLILFLTSFSFYVEHLLVERKFFSDTAENLTAEYYFHSTLKKIESTVQTTGSVQTNGTFYFQKGVVVFRAEPAGETSQTVNISLSLQSGVRINGKATYDLQTRKLMKWTE